MDGTVITLTIEQWKGFLYLPPGYEECTARRYPVAYLNSGRNMREELPVILDGLEGEFDKGIEPFLIVGYEPEDWNTVYTPWPAPAVFGREEFGGQADSYLRTLVEAVKPYVDTNYRTKPDAANTAIMGYSLGGLAAVYAVYRYECFGRAASLSGSLWYEGFREYMRTHDPRNPETSIYLSLGKKEGKSRNRQMREVVPATEEARESLAGKLLKPPELVWNEGGHFEGVTERWQAGMRALFGTAQEAVPGTEKAAAAETSGEGGRYSPKAEACRNDGNRRKSDGNLIFDSHAHYDDKVFEEDRESLLAGLAANGIGTVVNIGASIESTKRSIALAEKYSFLYAAAGVHPSETEELNEENFSWLSEAADHPKVVAVGEIGLDYYWDTAAKETQKIWFERQLTLACEKKLPVVIHSRDAAQDTLTMMKEARARADAKGQRLYGVIHCFSYGVEMAREYLNMGFYIGIGGVLTFKNAKKLKEVAAEVPLERIILETDCPYLTPEPYRGKRNCSLYLPYVVTALAQIKGVDEAAIIRVTRENAERMYGLSEKRSGSE
ncbi:MAG: YchF/TatD family DNA exonuclease [Lachnospiraceae bacterium]|nr:YchF/TatD family DNA exonuclease [Lachnospiraceae bacterium]